LPGEKTWYQNMQSSSILLKCKS